MSTEVSPARFDEMLYLSGPAKHMAEKLNREISKLWQQGIKIHVSVRTDNPLCLYGEPIIAVELSKPGGALYW
jgi:hypothetical protein